RSRRGDPVAGPTGDDSGARPGLSRWRGMGVESARARWARRPLPPRGVARRASVLGVCARVALHASVESGMRLASKIFLASSLVILVLVGVAAWSLLAVDRLVSVSREITTRTLPALRLQAGLRDSMLTLVRLEARSLLLRDPTYGALWDERADHTRNALEQLARYLTSDGEREHLEETQLAFAEYRAAVQSERALLGRGSLENATQLSETSARAAAERVDAGLNRLGEATQAALEHSKAEAT